MVLETTSRRQFLKYSSCGGIAGLAGCVDLSGGGEFPSEDIRVIVAFSSGGGTDVYARKVMGKAAEAFDVEIQIENIPGSGGMRGGNELYNADPDGYTIAAYNVPGDVVTAIVHEPGFQFDEFTGVAAHAKNVLLLVGNPDANIKDFEDMVQRYRDGDLTDIGGMQQGTQLHILANVMKSNNEYDVAWENYIPYDGSGPVGQAVASGEIPVGIVTEPTAQQLQDRIDPIVALSSRGSSTYPDLGSPGEFGYPSIDYVGEVTRGFYAPPDTSSDVVNTLNDAIKTAVESDELQSWAGDAGLDLEYYGSRELMEEITTEAIETIPQEVDLDNLDS